MTTQLFNRREQERINVPVRDKVNDGKEIFNAFLDELYHEQFATEFEKSNPEAYNEQFKNFCNEHSI